MVIAIPLCLGYLAGARVGAPAARTRRAAATWQQRLRRRGRRAARSGSRRRSVLCSSRSSPRCHDPGWSGSPARCCSARLLRRAPGGAGGRPGRSARSALAVVAAALRVGTVRTISERFGAAGAATAVSHEHLAGDAAGRPRLLADGQRRRDVRDGHAGVPARAVAVPDQRRAQPLPAGRGGGRASDRNSGGGRAGAVRARLA